MSVEDDTIRREPTSAGLWGRNYRVGYWIAWLAVLGFLITAAVAFFGHSAASAAGTCGGGGDSDYNGDGLRDTAIADPDATIGGKAGSGAVTVVYGGTTAASMQTQQDLAWVPGDAEGKAQFGRSLAHGDFNADGCSDLAVGAPYKDVGTARDSGSVYVLFGAAGGLGTGQASVTYDQTGVTASQGPEAGDLFGFALTGGTTSTALPFLVIGSPGEDTTAGADAGLIHYLSGKPLTSVVVSQDSTGVWETAEANDRFGASLASTDRYFTVGSPGESISTAVFAGAIHVFRPSLNTSGIPEPVFGLGQTPDAPAGTDKDLSAEPYDRFGTSLAMAPHRISSEASALGAVLAVGVPGEDLGTQKLEKVKASLKKQGRILRCLAQLPTSDTDPPRRRFQKTDRRDRARRQDHRHRSRDRRNGGSRGRRHDCHGGRQDIRRPDDQGRGQQGRCAHLHDDPPVLGGVRRRVDRRGRPAARHGAADTGR